MVERNAPLAIAAGKTAVSFDPSSGRLRAERPGCAWAWDEAYEPAFLTAAGERVPFGAAREKTFLARETSLGPELVCRYADFPGAGVGDGCRLDLRADAGKGFHHGLTAQTVSDKSDLFHTCSCFPVV